ncbi:thiolase family protein [Xylophilus sp. GOD-11R]|uniref:thiolase family protein n=1 Tax=Xylophilus sp. GOD-11R TaxID=3089814 RepID=UPI00298CE202|nr:thiolase family protein [Xylophilus sp. GOD-11R]WPB58373.1 thiolase family protein [Xylophilus sp. GOD-11R]
MKNAVIVDVVRSPMGRSKAGGAFVELHPNELLAQVLQGLVARNGLDPGTVDDVLIGCVSQVGEQSSTPGRGAWLAAGFPEHVPSTTIERKCGSSQQAVHFAAQGVMAGAYDIVIAGGIESMSRVPMGSGRVGRDPFGPSFQARYEPGLVGQGVAAELLAAQWGVTRDEMDAYAARSHALAEAARVDGQFERQIVPIRTGEGRVQQLDETIRPGTTAEKLATLAPSFAQDDLAERFAQIRWSVTAGNSSQISDGASAALIMSEERAVQLGLRPRARFVAFDVIGDDPLTMLGAPIPATRRVLAKAGMRLQDIDRFEVNEAFASVPLAWQRALDADPDRLNPSGGAIALGHPLGASGTRLLASLLVGLEASGGRWGLQTMCEAGGMANATVIERL